MPPTQPHLSRERQAPRFHDVTTIMAARNIEITPKGKRLNHSRDSYKEYSYQIYKDTNFLLRMKYDDILEIKSDDNKQSC